MLRCCDDTNRGIDNVLPHECSPYTLEVLPLKNYLVKGVQLWHPIFNVY